jgi:hypothetical protein
VPAFANRITTRPACSLIFRRGPWHIRTFDTLVGPFLANSIETGANNAVEAVLRGEGTSAFNWPKPGSFEDKFAIRVDPLVQKVIMDASRSVTGA